MRKMTCHGYIAFVWQGGWVIMRNNIMQILLGFMHCMQITCLSDFSYIGSKQFCLISIELTTKVYEMKQAILSAHRKIAIAIRMMLALIPTAAMSFVTLHTPLTANAFSHSLPSWHATISPSDWRSRSSGWYSRRCRVLRLALVVRLLIHDTPSATYTNNQQRNDVEQGIALTGH